MRSDLIVVASPVFNDDASFQSIAEPLHRQTLIAEFSVKTFIGAVLPRGLVHKHQTLSGLLRQLNTFDQPKPRLYLVAPIAGFVGQVAFARALSANMTVHMIPLDTMYGSSSAVQDPIPVIAARVAKYLQRHHVSGPVHLMGLSGGVRVVIETGCLLIGEARLRIGELLMTDSGPTFSLKSLQKQYNVSAWENWKPPHYSGTITELVALKDKHNQAIKQRNLGWAAYCSQIRTLAFNGRHGDALACTDLQQALVRLLVPEQPNV